MIKNKLVDHHINYLAREIERSRIFIRGPKYRFAFNNPDSDINFKYHLKDNYNVDLHLFRRVERTLVVWNDSLSLLPMSFEQVLERISDKKIVKELIFMMDLFT